MKKRGIATIFLFICLVVLGYISFKWLKHRQEYIVSNAVFVKTEHISNIGFKRVKGKITHLYKTDGDFVKKGEIVAELDNSTYITNLKELIKKIDALKNKKKSLEVKIDRLNSQILSKIQIADSKIKMIEQSINSQKFLLKEIDINIKQLNRDYKRFKYLYSKKVIAKKKFEDIETKLKSLKSKKKSLNSSINALIIQKKIAEKEKDIAKEDNKIIVELKSQLAAINDNIAQLEIEEKDLKDMIGECRLKSAVSGYVGKKYQEVGNIIKKGAPIYSIVDLDSIYILVMLEENKFKGLKSGAPVNIKIDALPDKIFKGKVSAILPATAATYALVPRDISAGEFTKVAQRLFVKIEITEGDKKLLKVGMGGEVEIKKVTFK